MPTTAGSVPAEGIGVRRKAAAGDELPRVLTHRGRVGNPATHMHSRNVTTPCDTTTRQRQRAKQRRPNSRTIKVECRKTSRVVTTPLIDHLRVTRDDDSKCTWRAKRRRTFASTDEHVLHRGWGQGRKPRLDS